MSLRLKQKLAAGEAIIGTWVSLADSAVVEILSNTGFDFLLLDGEHAPIGEDVLKGLLLGAKGSETAVILCQSARTTSRAGTDGP